MTNTRKINFIVLVALGIFAFTIMLCAGPMKADSIVAKAEEEAFTITQGMYDVFTDTDNLLYDTDKKISDYPSNSLYKSTSSITATNNSLSLSVTGDDPIVQIVPKILFITVGEHLYIGKEYGFFVSTVAQSATGNNRRSAVMVFDITTSTNLVVTVDRLIVGLTPIFQYEYVYLTPEEQTFDISSTSNRSVYNRAVSYNISSPMVVPIAVANSLNTAVTYEALERYYLKDVCFTAQALNEQALNQNSTNYDKTKDNGTFFTAVDYTYDGLSKYIIDTTTEQEIIFALDTVSVVFGVASLIHPSLAILGVLSTVISGTTYAYNLATENYQIFQQGESDFEAISSGQLRTKQLYTTRESQLAQYNGLAKAVGVCINTNGKDSIWYGTNSNATAYFTVSNSGDDYTRFYREIGLQVVDSDGNQKCIGSSMYSYTSGTPDTVIMQFESTANVYLLPDGKNSFDFNAPYLSDYTVTVNSTTPVSLKVNNSVINGTNNVFNVRLSAGNNIPIEIYGNTGFLTTTIEISPSTSLTDISIPANSNYLVCINNDLLDCKKFSSSNTNAVINNIFQISTGTLSEYRFNGTIFISGNSITLPVSIGKKYILLTNISSSAISTNLNIGSPDTLGVGVAENTTIKGVYTYYKFVVTEIKSYTFTFDFLDTSISKLIYDSNFIAKTTISSAKSMEVNDLTPGTYWIAYLNSLNNDVISGEIVVRESQNSYKWIVDGNEINGQDISLEINTSHSIEFRINNIEYISDFETDNRYVTTNDGIITIMSSCNVGQTTEIRAYVDSSHSSSYTYILTITCLAETKVKIISVTNTQTQLAFNWQVTNSAVTGFVYTTNNGNSYQVAVSNATTGTENFLSNVDYSLITSTITITNVIYGSEPIVYKGDSTSVYSTNVCFASGRGTEADPFIIAYPRHFNNIKYASNAGTSYFYKQTENIDFNNTATERNVKFYGHYESNAKSMTNIVISDGSSAVGGLFSENFGTITPHSHLSVTINASGKEAMVGGVAGINYGSITTSVLFTVNIESFWEKGAVGGIAGKNEVNATITPGMTAGTIKAKSDVGGIAGINNGTINSGVCGVSINYYQYTTTNRSIGGIVGLNNPAGKLIGSMTYSGTITYSGYTAWYSSWNGVEVDLDFDPRIGKIIGENCANVSANLTANFTYSNATINIDLLKATQQDCVSLSGYIGNNKA